MARTTLPVTQVTRFALTPDSTPLAGDTVNGMIMVNDGVTYINMTSTSGSTQTVTVLAPAGFDVNLTAGPRPYSIPPNGKGKAGFFPVSIYGAQLLFSVTSNLVSFTAYTFGA